MSRQSYAGYEKGSLSKPTGVASLDEFTEQLDAFASGRVDELPTRTRPVSMIRTVQSVGSNLSSRKLFGAVCVCVCVCVMCNEGEDFLSELLEFVVCTVGS